MNCATSREDRLGGAPGRNLQIGDTFVSSPPALTDGPWPNGVVRRA